MRKLIHVRNVLILLVIIFMCLFKIPFIDDFISLKIFPDEKTQSPEPGIIVRDKGYSDDIYPLIAVTEGRINIMYNGKYVNLLPEEYKVDGDSKKKIYDQLFKDDNLTFSKDGSKAAFILTVSKTAYLFLCDLEKEVSVQVDEKVDSFALSPDGGSLFYATGYLYSNTLFLYTEGKSNYIAENVSALYFSDHNAVVIKTGALRYWKEERLTVLTIILQETTD